MLFIINYLSAQDADVKLKSKMKGFVVFLMISALSTMFAFGNNSKREKTNDKEEQSSVLVEDVLISGTVINSKDGKPMEGVSVILKGSTIDTVTDVNGKYLIKVPNDAVLLYAYIGMDSIEVIAGNRQIINVLIGSEVLWSNGNIQISLNDKSQSGTPLYLVDGKETDNLKSISSDRIGSLSILKDKEAVEKYGEKGKNGVILITLKK
jgi:hypothetical protein